MNEAPYAHAPKSLPEVILTGLKCRCPRCGEGHIFSGFLKLVEECAVCKLPLARDDSGDGPAVFLIFILGFVVVPPALLIAMKVDWPLWLHTLIWGGLILALTLGMLRPAKGVTVGLQYQYRRHDYEPPAP